MLLVEYRWSENWYVVIDASDFGLWHASELRRRPFYLEVFVDSPIKSRLSRSGMTSEAFILNEVSVSEVIVQCDAVLYNKFESITLLHEHLAD